MAVCAKYWEEILYVFVPMDTQEISVKYLHVSVEVLCYPPVTDNCLCSLNIHLDIILP